MKEHVAIEVLLGNLENFIDLDKSNIELYSKGFKGVFSLNADNKWIFSLEAHRTRYAYYSNSEIKRRLKTYALIYQFEKATSEGDEYVLYFRTLSGRTYKAVYLHLNGELGMGYLKIVNDFI